MRTHQNLGWSLTTSRFPFDNGSILQEKLVLIIMQLTIHLAWEPEKLKEKLEELWSHLVPHTNPGSSQKFTWAATESHALHRPLKRKTKMAAALVLPSKSHILSLVIHINPDLCRGGNSGKYGFNLARLIKHQYTTAFKNTYLTLVSS